MNDNTNTNTQQQTTPTPEADGGAGRMFTQEEVNRIVSDRLSRERAKPADDDSYRGKYEALQKELESMKAAQLHQAKTDAYRKLLTEANISEKRIAAVMRASVAEIDAVELDGNGQIVGADKLIEGIQSDWADFVVTTEVIGADVPHPPGNILTRPETMIADAFKPKI